MREIKMMDSVKQVVITLFYIWIIYSISFSNRDTGSFNLQNDISNRLLTPSGKGAQQFQKVWFRFFSQDDDTALEKLDIYLKLFVREFAVIIVFDVHLISSYQDVTSVENSIT